jgi:hypothetical protein
LNRVLKLLTKRDEYKKALFEKEETGLILRRLVEQWWKLIE